MVYLLLVLVCELSFAAFPLSMIGEMNNNQHQKVTDVHGCEVVLVNICETCCGTGIELQRTYGTELLTDMEGRRIPFTCRPKSAPICLNMLKYV